MELRENTSLTEFAECAEEKVFVCREVPTNKNTLSEFSVISNECNEWARERFLACLSRSTQRTQRKGLLFVGEVPTNNKVLL